ncbi:AGAP007075-PA-like protein [Anopheles sinensis]|uniref:AGAP007075-PA-like protein n=1 Tax=Anopheles sinensis TaxID=74873 RepID=A0A084WED8_ANOSI|nr:AGAP007075-PA-like protein [Anopheles sinensis]
MEKNLFLVLLTILSVVQSQQVVASGVQADRNLGGRKWGHIRLPPIFMYDDLAQCEARDSVYCYARTILREDRFPIGYVLPDTEVSCDKQDVLEKCETKCVNVFLAHEFDSSFVRAPPVSCTTTGRNFWS